ncbi:MAG TPA: putative quinol monooxygenase [Thermohalobaculum sp.]|nr:putative quinol monooxygenase [Thermohalobaculum sp.]
MPAIALVVEIELAPGRKDAFLARALAHRETVLSNEPGCLRFDLLTADEDDAMVFLYEVYADAAALETHFGTPYMKQYLADTGPMIAGRTRNRCTLAHD